jgi:ketosteroid isomerase-like protein
MATTPPPAPASPRQVVERIHRLVAEGTVEGQAELFAADGVLEWPFAPDGVPRRLEGREAIRATFAPLGRRMRAAGRRPPPVASVVVHETLDPEVVVAELALGGDDPLPYVQVFRVRDGQIVSFRDYFGPRTAAALAAGLGAAPAG